MPNPMSSIISCPVRDAGGARPEDGFDYHEIQHRRKTQEDAMAWSLLPWDQFSVASASGAQQLNPQEIAHRLWTTLQLMEEIEDPEECLFYQGCTATVTVHDGANLITATLGDSASFAVVYDKGGRVKGAMRLNAVVHKPEDDTERARIIAVGGCVEKDAKGGMRVGGEYGLAMSRSIGDRQFRGVCAEASMDIISIEQLKEKFGVANADFGRIEVITSCDGFTDAAVEFYPPRKAKPLMEAEKESHEKFLRQMINFQAKDDLRSLSEYLVATAAPRSGDNISVAVQKIGEIPFIIGIFDGHGGSGVAHLAARSLVDIFQAQCALGKKEYAAQSLSVFQRQAVYDRDNASLIGLSLVAAGSLAPRSISMLMPTSAVTSEPPPERSSLISSTVTAAAPVPAPIVAVIEESSSLEKELPARMTIRERVTEALSEFPHIISCPEGDAQGANAQFGFEYHEIQNPPRHEHDGRRETQEDALAWSILDPKQFSTSAGAMNRQEIAWRLWTTLRTLDQKEFEGQGSTASVTVYDGSGNLVTATLGDAVSFAALYNKEGEMKGIKRLNSDVHKPIQEMERITQAGGTVERQRVSFPRGARSLAISRAIGDSEFGRIVCAESKIDITSIEELKEELEVDDLDHIKIITTCDGFTEAAPMLGLHGDKKKDHEGLLKALLISHKRPFNCSTPLAQYLVLQAQKRSRDNISVAIQTLFPRKTSPFLIAVFDGHGGKAASHYAARSIDKEFKRQCALSRDEYNEQALSVSNNQVVYDRDNFSLLVETAASAAESSQPLLAKEELVLPLSPQVQLHETIEEIPEVHSTISYSSFAIKGPALDQSDPSESQPEIPVEIAVPSVFTPAITPSPDDSESPGKISEQEVQSEFISAPDTSQPPTNCPPGSTDGPMADSATPERVMNVALTALKRALEDMQNYGEWLNNQNRGDDGQKISALVHSLLGEAQRFSQELNDNPTAAKFKQFKQEMIHLMDDKDLNLHVHHKKWKPIVANVLVALTGIGAALLLVKIAKETIVSLKNNTPLSFNNTLFFAKTNREKKVANITHELNKINLS